MALVGINSRKRFEGQEPMELQTVEFEVAELTIDKEPIAIDTTAPGKIDLSKTVKAESKPSIPLEMGKAKIIELWENGILSNLAYVYCAIQYLKINEDPKAKKSIRRNWEQFVGDWAGTVDADTGKRKMLTKKALFMALLAIEDKTGDSLVSGEIEIQLELLPCK